MAKNTKLKIWKDNANEKDYKRLLEALRNEEDFPTEEFPFSKNSAKEILNEHGLWDIKRRKKKENTGSKIFDIDGDIVEDSYSNTSVMLSSSVKKGLEKMYEANKKFNKKYVLNQILKDVLSEYGID